MNTTRSPIARTFSISDLPGRVAKTVAIPERMRGIIIRPDQRVEWLDSGKHTLVSASQRISGKGIGLQAGLLPDHPFTGAIQTGPILSKDHELVYASVVFEVSACDPEQFFRTQVLPNRTLIEPVDCSDGFSIQAVSGCAQQFTAQEFAGGIPTLHLHNELKERLSPALAQQGLSLDRIYLLAFQSPADRAASIELAKKQASEGIEQSKLAQWEAAGLRRISSEQLATGSADTVDWLEQPEHKDAIDAWITMLTERGRIGGQRRNLEDLFRRQRRSGENASVTDRRWWLRYAVRAAAAVLLGVLLARLSLLLADTLGWTLGWLIAAGIGVFALLLLLDSIRAWILKREARAEAGWPSPAVSELDEMVGPARHRVDSLLRDQCASDLAEVVNGIKDIRHGLYLQGNEELAIRANRLRARLDQSIENVRSPGYGQPPYLRDFKVPPIYWQDLLDVEEQVLAQAQTLTADLQDIQEQFRRTMPVETLFDQFEAHLEAFNRQFAGRSRFLNYQEGELEAYQQ